MDFPKMEVLAVWTKHGQHADYLCLEPWHGMPTRSEDIGPFEDKLFVTLLQSLVYHVRRGSLILPENRINPSLTIQTEWVREGF